MNSRIQEIVIGHVGEHAPLIAELEAYHNKAMVEAADGALMGRAMLDRALDVRPGAQSPGDAVREYVAGVVNDLRVRRDALVSGKPREKLYGFYSRKAHQYLSEQCAFRGIPPSHYYETPDGGRVLVTRVSSDPAAPEYKWNDKVCKGEVTRFIQHGPTLHASITDIIERNATAWQGGESDDERARR